MNAESRLRTVLGTLILSAAVWGAGAAAPPAYAQKPPAAASPAIPAEPAVAAVDAQRGALDRFLDVHPEIGNQVMNHPGSLSDENYLKEHPAVQAFLDSHPLVKADPRAFISPREWRYQDTRSDIDMFLGYIVPFAVFFCILLAVIWVARTLIESRRWNRSFKMHEDLHTKLMEKFASGQDFRAYLESDAGRRLLEWTPPEPETSHRLPITLGRILWSLEAGVVLFLVGMGLLVLREFMEATAAPPLLVFGTLGVTLGAGFVLSALLSYGMAKRLGLMGGSDPAKSQEIVNSGRL
jgi:hypothetical protein